MAVTQTGEVPHRRLGRTLECTSKHNHQQAAGIRREVELLTSPRSQDPADIRHPAPVVVLPVDAMEWDTYRRQAVLLHELAHISRWDALAQKRLDHVACTVYWFNPLVWFAARSARYERELACDDFVLSMGAPASGYANELLTMVSGLQKRDSYAVALAMARRSQFEGRLLALLDPKQERKGMTARFAIVAGALALVLALPLAALQQQEAVPPAPPSPPAAPAAMSEPPLPSAHLLPRDSPPFRQTRRHPPRSPRPPKNRLRRWLHQPWHPARGATYASARWLDLRANTRDCRGSARSECLWGCAVEDDQRYARRSDRGHAGSLRTGRVNAPAKGRSHTAGGPADRP